jgi:hypothetical protein
MNTCRILVKEAGSKRRFRLLEYRMNKINVVKDRDQWLAFEVTVMNLYVSKELEIYLADGLISASQK